jgi:ubiquinone/menaquinone biosynthesis C-methylase UbiE
MSATAASFAGCCAELYELPVVEYLLGESFHPGGDRLTRQLASSTLVAPKSEVLDVACGNGKSARTIAADFGATVTGIDISAKNTQRAIVAAQAAGLSERTNFICGSAENLPFEPLTFDVALCECSLCLFENTGDALRRMRHVLKPGGRIGISDFFLNAPVPRSLDNLLGQVLCVTGALSAKGYQEALLAAGFEYVRVRQVNWTLVDMIKRIRRRLKLLATSSATTDISLPPNWGDPVPVLADLESFIADGGAGYLMATARRPVMDRSQKA